MSENRPYTFAAAIQAAAQDLLVMSTPDYRELGRALIACEPLKLYKSEEERSEGRQDLIGRIGVANDADRKLLETQEVMVAQHLSRALGLWSGAITLKFDPINPKQWVHALRPVKPLADCRLDRYLNDAVRSKPEGVRKEILVEHEGEARIILRRLRYRSSWNWGERGNDMHRNLQVWTTSVGEKWCELFDKYLSGTHQAVQYLPYYLLTTSTELDSLSSVDPCIMDSNNWGDVNPENDPIRVLQVTTRTGSTQADVESVLERAGQQLKLSTRYTKKSDREQPLGTFKDALEKLSNDSVLNGIDVLLVHRGGGVITDGAQKNVSAKDREAIYKAVEFIRSRGVEVVLAIGHADARVFERNRHKKVIGFFEATTPTAGAAWILKEHINSQLVDDEDVYAQP